MKNPIVILVLVLEVVLLVTTKAAAAKVCYFTQEPDPSENNRLRWIQPFKGMCSCTSTRPGGLNTVALDSRDANTIYTDNPLFTRDPEVIHDHYGCHDKLANCQALLDAGNTEDGIYTVYPFQNDEGMNVSCDMTNHTGWIMVQQRYNGSVNFNRSWADYKGGFGSLDGEFWLGNEVLHKLTDEGNWTIRMDLTNELGSTGHLMKTPFHIKQDDYTLCFGYSSIQPTVGRYCGHKLGMEDKSIPDDRITASSTSNTETSYRLPSNARLNLNRYWAPATGQAEDSWLQVAMGTEPVQIEGVVTQGSPDRDIYVKHYKVQYSIDGVAWMYVNGTSTIPQTFHGNTDKNTPVTNIFKQPVRARYIRIRPTDWNNFPTLRIELLGCQVDGVCGQSLGMKDGSIPDDRITTSSTDEGYCPENPQGRLDVSGGWCPTLSDTAWYQVDLQPTLVQGVITQGNDMRYYWVTKFLVSYSDHETDWRYIGGTSKDTAHRFPGNIDNNTRVTNMFNESIRVRFIRIIPTASYNGYRPSMRIELLGCNERWFCLHRLGMGDGSIPDYRITASSTKWREDGNCQPSNARLTQSADSNHIGWCPEPTDGQPWLQIDLETKVTVEGIMMLQGSDQGTSVYTSYEYQLEHSDDQSTWHLMNSTQIIRKNTTSNTASTSMFHPPITARYIRIILNQTDGSLWIRVELLGCKVHWVCGQHLGMEDHSIPDSRITASSINQDRSDTPSNCQPSNGRLNQIGNGPVIGGWCAAQNDKESSWLQIDLLMVTSVEGVIIQGIDDNTWNWRVTSYQVEYSLNDITWYYVSGHGASPGQPQTFRGNTDQSTPVTSRFEQPIRARFVRIRPISYEGYPAMRIELIGCRSGILDTANNQAFSVNHRSKDFNPMDESCPSLNSEGCWWYNRFSGTPGIDNNLNGEYIQPGDIMGPYNRVIRASEWNGTRIVKTEIKIRRQSPPRG